MALNEANPYSDGDQSFVRAVLETDPGTRLRLARVVGMDLLPDLMSEFGRTCYVGHTKKVQDAIEATTSRKKLVSRRELMLRYSPLHLTVRGARAVHDTPQGRANGGCQWTAVPKSNIFSDLVCVGVLEVVIILVETFFFF